MVPTVTTRSRLGRPRLRLRPTQCDPDLSKRHPERYFADPDTWADQGVALGRRARRGGGRESSESERRKPTRHRTWENRQREMALKLHRCQNLWVKVGGHPCWRVQRELDAAGIDYEIVTHPWFGKRDRVVELTGQKKLPSIEHDDGTILREESKDLAARIRRGDVRSDGHGTMPEPVDGT